MRFCRPFLMIPSGFILASAFTLFAQEMTPKGSAPKVIAVSENKLDEYAGQYRAAIEPDVVNSVYREGGSLFVEGERWPRVELKAESADHFFVSDSPLRAEFVRDADGKVSGLKMSFGAGGERLLDRFNNDGVRLNHFREYTRAEAMIPMRDGAKLHAVILRPKGSESSGPALPFLMQRTPYGTDNDSSNSVNVS